MRKLFILFILLSFSMARIEAQVTLLFPDDGEELTDIAVSFKAKIPTNGPYYLYVSKNEDFSGDVIRRPAQTGKGEIQFDVQYFLTYQGKVTPNDKFMLEPGTWYWRVSGDGGKTFSETRTLYVNDNKPLTPAEWDVSPSKPIFHMRMRSDLVDHAPNGDIEGQLKKIIPDHLKDYVVLDIGQSFHWLPDERSLYEYCKIFDDLGYKYWFDLGSHAWLGRIASLGEMEKVFRDLDHCVGACTAEIFYYIYQHDAERSMMDGALELCRKYGKKYLHSDMNWKWAKWPYFNHLYWEIFEERNYADYYIPQFKTTAPWGTYTNISTLQGMKLSGMVNDIGIWADFWCWEKFGQVNESDLVGWLTKTVHGNEKNYPFMQNIKQYIYGITFGSTTFALESNLQWHWQTCEPNDHYYRYLEPFISAVVQEQIIPSEASIANNFNVIVDNDYNWSNLGSTPPLTYVEGNVWGDFLRSTYGISDIESYNSTASAGGVQIIEAAYSEMIPNSDRYPSGIPFLPKHGIGAPEVKGKKLEVIDIEDLDELSEVNENLNIYYPESNNEAYAQRIDSSIFVYNTYENHDIRQKYAMGIHFAGIDSLMGEIDLMSYVIGRCKADSKTIFFQTNAYIRNAATWNNNGGKYELPPYPTVLKFKCQTEPTLESDKIEAIDKNWNEAAKILKLEIDHTSAGAVNFTLIGTNGISYEADSIRAKVKTADVRISEQIKLDGSIYPESLEGIGIEWRSLNPNVARITSNGMVTGTGLGEALIVAELGNKRDTVTITTQTIPLEGFKFEPNTYTIERRQRDTLKISTIPFNATSPTFSYESRDTKIVKVDEDGIIRGILPGETYVIAYHEATGAMDSCLVTVTPRTGVEDSENSEIKVFPNPVNEMLHIYGLNDSSTISILDLNGKKLVEKNSIDKIDLSHLNQGLYLVKVITHSKAYCTKIFKK